MSISQDEETVTLDEARSFVTEYGSIATKVRGAT